MKKLIAALGLASTVLIVGCNNNKTPEADDHAATAGTTTD